MNDCGSAVLNDYSCTFLKVKVWLSSIYKKNTMAPFAAFNEKLVKEVNFTLRGVDLSCQVIGSFVLYSRVGVRVK